MASQATSLEHTGWICKYHIAAAPKYLKKAICNECRKSLQKIIGQLYKHKGVEIPEGHMMPDHVHMLVSIPPKTSVQASWNISLVWQAKQPV